MLAWHECIPCITAAHCIEAVREVDRDASEAKHGHASGACSMLRRHLHLCAVFISVRLRLWRCYVAASLRKRQIVCRIRARGAGQVRLRADNRFAQCRLHAANLGAEQRQTGHAESKRH